MSVVTAYEETGPCRRKLTIEIPVEAVDAEMNRVVGSFRKNIKLPGFRQGKVPASVIRKRFDGEIRQEVVDRLLPRYWHQAQSEKNLDPLIPPQFEELELEAGKPMTLVALVETRPEITLGEISDFKLPNTDSEVQDSEVDEVLHDLRRRHATWTPVDRAAGQGDLVSGRRLDVTADDEDSVTEEPLTVEVGGEGVDDELSLAVTGRSAGQSAEYSSKVGDEDRNFRVEILAVKEQELPELDDELATKTGLDSLEALREAIAADLKRSKDQRNKMEREKAMLEQLRERHPVELPPRVVDKESEGMLREYAERLQSQGLDVSKAEIDWEGLATSVKPEAERRVHDRLLLDAVGTEKSFKLDEKEFERFLAAAAAQQQQTSLALRQQLSESGRLEPLRAEMLREQTKRHLLGEDPSETDESSTDSENEA